MASCYSLFCLLTLTFGRSSFDKQDGFGKYNENNPEKCKQHKKVSKKIKLKSSVDTADCIIAICMKDII